MFTLSSIITEYLRYIALAAEMEIYLPLHNCPGVWTEQVTSEPHVQELQKDICLFVLTKAAGLIGKGLLCFANEH